jgi:hypothetical protein
VFAAFLFWTCIEEDKVYGSGFYLKARPENSIPIGARRSIPRSQLMSVTTVYLKEAVTTLKRASKRQEIKKAHLEAKVPAQDPGTTRGATAPARGVK